MAKTVKEQIINAFTWAKEHLVRKLDVVNSTSGTSTTLPASAAAAKSLQDQINTLNTKIGLKSVYVNQPGTYKFNMIPGTLALVITYYGLYPHYCNSNGVIAANIVAQKGAETVTTAVAGNEVSVYNKGDGNTQAIILFL